MAIEYETFVTTIDELSEGKEIELLVMDKETYEPQKVKAIVSSSKEKLPDGDTLWIRYSRGLLHKEPWVIKVTGKLPLPID